MYFLTPLESVQFLVWSRPSIMTSPPFLRYCVATSASRPQAITVWYSVASLRWPEGSFQTRLVAILIVATFCPLGIDLESGSWVNLPIKTTLFRFTDLLLINNLYKF